MRRMTGSLSHGKGTASDGLSHPSSVGSHPFFVRMEKGEMGSLLIYTDLSSLHPFSSKN